MSATNKAEMQEKEDKLVIEEGQDGSLTVSGLPDKVPEGDDKEAAEAKAPASEGEQTVIPLKIRRPRRNPPLMMITRMIPRLFVPQNAHDAEPRNSFSARIRRKKTGQSRRLCRIAQGRDDCRAKRVCHP